MGWSRAQQPQSQAFAKKDGNNLRQSAAKCGEAIRRRPTLMELEAHLLGWLHPILRHLSPLRPVVSLALQRGFLPGLCGRGEQICRRMRQTFRRA
jgi:hypothetical protein